jgi:RNA polymerase sigma-70 factor, ECF subfamily
METETAGRSDAGLVASVAGGDAAALAELYDRHADAIYRTAFRRLGDRQLAEEILQDTYLALWNRAELYDPTAGSLLAWLSTIARNRAIDRMRAIGRRPAAIPLSAMTSDDDGDDRGLERALGSGGALGTALAPLDPEQYVDAGELRDQVRAALDAIPANERQALELAYYEELTQSEIADRLGWPLGTVKTRTRRGLMRLRQSLVGILGPEVAPPPGYAPPGPEYVLVPEIAYREVTGASDGPR